MAWPPADWREIDAAALWPLSESVLDPSDQTLGVDTNVLRMSESDSNPVGQSPTSIGYLQCGAPCRS